MKNFNNSGPTPKTVTNSWWGDGGCSRPCFSTQPARVLAPSWRVPSCRRWFPSSFFRLEAAPRAFHANRWILTDRHVSLATKLRYFDTVTSTMLMWYSENCFEAWSAQLLPQTGHHLGMKSRWVLVRALCGNALELGAIGCQPSSGPLVVPHSDVDVQRKSHCWSSSKHLGHHATELLQVSALGQLEGRDKGANRWANLMPQVVFFCTES